MLNYNPVIKNEMKQESISVKEIYPVIKINLRGKKREFLTNVGKNLNMILPTEANTSTTIVVEVFASVGKIILRFLPTFVKNSLFLPLKLIFITG